MPNDRNDCPKCGAQTEPGFIIDYTYGYGSRVQSKWVEGTPITSRLFGLKLKGKRAIYVSTFRCTSCGFLESYAASR